MTTEINLDELINSKENLFDAINERGEATEAIAGLEDKGVYVTAGTPFRRYSNKILDIYTDQVKNQNKTLDDNGAWTCDAGYTGIGTATVFVKSSSDIEGNLGIYREFKDGSVEASNSQRMSVNFEGVKRLGTTALQYAFNNCAGLYMLNFPDLEYIGNNACHYAFQNCTKLVSISFPKLYELDEYAMRYAFTGCTRLKSVEFPELTLMEKQRGMTFAFQSCTELEEILLPKVEVAGLFAFYNLCTGAKYMKKMSFDSLHTIKDNYTFQYAFQNCTSLEEVYLPKLKKVPATPDSSFNGMLNGCKNVRVYFPSNMQETLSKWPDIISGMGGTETRVEFTLPPV